MFAPFFDSFDALLQTGFSKVDQCNTRAATRRTQAVYTCPSSFWNHLWDAQARCTMDTAISMSFPVAFRSYQAKTTLTVRPGRPRRRMQTTQAYTVCCTDVFPVKIDELCNVNFLSNVEVTGSFLQPLAWYLTSKHTVPSSRSTAWLKIAVWRVKKLKKPVHDDHSMQRCLSLKPEHARWHLQKFHWNVNESKNAW